MGKAYEIMLPVTAYFSFLVLDDTLVEKVDQIDQQHVAPSSC